MRKIMLILFLHIAMIACGQNFSKSYSAVSCYNQMGMQDCPAGLSTYIDFYDNYIYVMGVGKCTYSGKNLDGSRKYTPITPGTPALQTVAIIVSSNYNAMQQVQFSTLMGMTMQIVYNYQWIGDGRHPAENLMGTTPQYYDGGNHNCSVCHGSKLCKYCHGTGRYEYSQNGRCGVCRGTGRCQACNR